MTATVPSPRVALVVDDDPDLALLCALHLQAAGYQVVEAYTGAQALDLARSAPPSVVVLDRMLTDCDGLEVLAALREDGRTAGVPVVMVSARAYDQDRIDAQEAGVQDYVVKPFDAEELVAAVDGAVDAALHAALHAGASRGASGTPSPVMSPVAGPADPVALLESELVRLREVDERRMEYLSSVSHDLRTPLTAVKGFGEWLALNWDSTPDDHKLALLQRILDAGGRLDALVQDLVEYSRLERGKLHVDLAPCRVSDLVEESLQQLAPTLEHHAVDVHLEDDATLLCDRDAMVRVMGNLLTNAAKFSPQGSTVHITSQAAPVLVPAGRTGRADDLATGSEADVLLSVRDEGMGIDATEHDRVFDRFYRVPSTETRPGSGIGLALVKQYVEAQDGSVALSSVPGEGSDFTLRLRTVPGQR